MSACTDDLKLVKATGTVTFKGQPFAGATVTLIYDNGSLATGTTDNDGKFKLTANGRDGAFVGKAKVTVSKINRPGPSGMPANPTPADMVKMASEKKEGMKQQEKPTNELPDKYSNPDTSGLTAEVAKSGTNEFTFPLVDAT